MLSKFSQINKILITGGSGFIGQSLYEHWCYSDHCLLVPSHKELDLTDNVAVGKYLKKENPDIIVHAAIAGNGKSTDTYQDFLANMRMFDNLVANDKPGRPVFLFGSGAEFDRTKNIQEVTEDEGLKRWPLDYYGLAKSIQTRRALDGEFSNPYVLRLFGCFGYLEKETRFIKNSIINLTKGNGIQIEQDKEMDFIYIKDVCKIIDEILWRGRGPRNVNLVYDEKVKLSQIAETILYWWDRSGFPPKDKIWFNNESSPIAYSGNGTRLKNTGIPLIGLKGGIGQTIEKVARLCRK